MKHLSKILLAFCVCLIFTAATSAQSKDHSTATAFVKDGGKAAVVVVGSAARGSWAVTKFASKYIAAPVAKTIFVKAAPEVGKFALKQSAKRLLPLAVKLSVL